MLRGRIFRGWSSQRPGRVRTMLMLGESGLTAKTGWRETESALKGGERRLFALRQPVRGRACGGLPSFASWFLTNIWSLAGMNPTMASQTGRLVARVSMLGEAEVVVRVGGGEVCVAYIGECLLAPIMVTDMRFFASMSARVHGQGTALNKALVAIFDITMIRSLIGMYAIMAT